MKPISARERETITAAIQASAKDGELTCAETFKVAGEIGVRPLAMGQVADELGVRLMRCQLGLFGYAPSKSIVEPADEVAPERAHGGFRGLEVAPGA